MQQAKQLAEDLREQIKALGFDRHKLIIQVLVPGRFSAAEKLVSRLRKRANKQSARCAYQRCQTDLESRYMSICVTPAGHGGTESGTSSECCFALSVGPTH